MKPIAQLVADLVAATPPPPSLDKVTASEVAAMGAKLVEQRKPILDAITVALTRGAKLDPHSRARLEAVQKADARWRELLELARTQIGDRLVALRRLDAGKSASGGTTGPARPLVHLKL
jgi:hypothetical protein